MARAINIELKEKKLHIRPCDGKRKKDVELWTAVMLLVGTTQCTGDATHSGLKIPSEHPQMLYV